MKPPWRVGAAHDADRIAALDYEIFQEKAATLARLGRRLNEALRALSVHDATGPGGGEEQWQERRRALVAAAGEALWYFVVQREVCGLPCGEALLDGLGVPREVRLRMGIPTSGRATRVEPDRRSDQRG